MNIIEQLKKNEKPFGLMSEEMQEKAKMLDATCGVRFCVYSSDGQWGGLKDIDWEGLKDIGGGFRVSTTYRLHPDYAEECPECGGRGYTYNGFHMVPKSPCSKGCKEKQEEPEPEKINVRMIRGDGFISPVSTSSIDAHIMWYANKPYVPLSSLEYANKSISSAEYWLKKLCVWGDSNVVQKIYKLVHPEWYKKNAEEPEIVECEIYKGQVGVLTYNRGDTFTACQIGCAFRDPDFIGFKFEDGSIRAVPIVYRRQDGHYDSSSWTNCIASCVAPGADSDTVLHATHVLFRRIER